MFLFWTLAQADAGGGPWWYQVLPIIGMVAIMYFLLLRPQIKEQRKHQALINGIKKGDKVITSGGIYGEIETVDAQTVLLKVNDKTKIQVSRSHIQGFQPAAAAAPPAEQK